MKSTMLMIGLWNVQGSIGIIVSRVCSIKNLASYRETQWDSWIIKSPYGVVVFCLYPRLVLLPPVSVSMNQREIPDMFPCTYWVTFYTEEVISISLIYLLFSVNFITELNLMKEYVSRRKKGNSSNRNSLYHVKEISSAVFVNLKCLVNWISRLSETICQMWITFDNFLCFMEKRSFCNKCQFNLSPATPGQWPGFVKFKKKICSAYNFHARREGLPEVGLGNNFFNCNWTWVQYLAWLSRA